MSGKGRASQEMMRLMGGHKRDRSREGSGGVIFAETNYGRGGERGVRGLHEETTLVR